MHQKMNTSIASVSGGSRQHDDNESSSVFFLYAGGTVAIPDNVIHIRIDPSVTTLPRKAFNNLPQLREVSLHEGMVEIKEQAFMNCHSLERINDIPPSLTPIGNFAFSDSGLLSLDLPEAFVLQSQGLFNNCNRLCNMRLPPSTTQIPEMTFCDCTSLFSVEIPRGVNRICTNALSNCQSLRNFAIPSLDGMGNDMAAETLFGNMFHHCHALLNLLGQSDLATRALLHRFDNLPTHQLMYFQSYSPIEITLARLKVSRNESNLTINQQDCLGMTPLHILACSRRISIELLHALVEAHPESLVTDDAWGALPLLYLFWGNASSEIIQFVCHSIKSHYPHHILPWASMVTTLSEHVPVRYMQNLLDTHKAFFPDQSIEWDDLIDTLAKGLKGTSIESLRFLMHYSTADTLRLIGIKEWRDNITKLIETLPKCFSYFQYIRIKLAVYTVEYLKLKDYSAILELALWKHRIDQIMIPATKISSAAWERKKKSKTNELAKLRKQCRVTCGADSVIDHVLSYLVPAKKSVRVCVHRGITGYNSRHNLGPRYVFVTKKLIDWDMM